MRDVVAPLYARLLATASARLEAHTRAGEGSDISRHSVLPLFPCPTPPEPWRALARALFPLLGDQRVLYSSLNGGCHLPLSQALLLEACATTAEVRSSRRRAGK